MKRMYARLVLWLIRPALTEEARRAAAASRAANEYWRSLGCPGGTFQAAGKGDEYWRARGFPDGFAEAAGKLSKAGDRGRKASAN
ncbi:hypothetical protein D3C81_880980 [compost metagenome]|jgi:hypothetical protein